MKNDQISRLICRSRENKLGHFYILSSSNLGDHSDQSLFDFCQNFISEYFNKIENQTHLPTNIRNHPNVWILGKTQDDDETNGKDYTVDEAMELIRFFDYKSIHGKRKFAIITEAHKIGTIVANKWLKLLEEPQGESTIFLLNPKGHKLLATLSSRAQYLYFSHLKQTEDDSNWEDFVHSAKDMPLAHFLETYSKSQDLEKLLQNLISWESQQNNSIKSKISLVDWLKEYKEMDTYHQPTATKWTLFYNYLKENVFTRN